MYYFIVNPNSGSGRGLRVWQTIERIIARKHIEYEAYLTEGPEQAGEYAAAITESLRKQYESTSEEESTDETETADEHVMVIVGGDGTFSEVLNGMDTDAPVTVGYVPVGVGNDLARSLRLSRSVNSRIRRILRAKKYRNLDYGIMTVDGADGEACHRRFIVSSGIGLDADICHREDSMMLKILFGKLRLDRLSRFFARYHSCRSAVPSKGYIVLNGERRVEFNNIFFVSAMLLPYECGGMKIGRDAGRGNGELSICVYSNSSRTELMNAMRCAAGGRRKIRGLRTYSCKEAKIHTEIPFLVHADGESSGNAMTDIQVSCVKGKIRMII